MDPTNQLGDIQRYVNELFNEEINYRQCGELKSIQETVHDAAFARELIHLQRKINQAFLLGRRPTEEQAASLTA